MKVSFRAVSGWVVLPALVNAHDHLSLNHYPRTRPRERYVSAHDWGADVNALLDQPPYRDLRARPLRDRLFIGGVKNLLCGALMVMHHDPPHRSLWSRDYPVRVVRRYTWAHSFGFADDAAIMRAHRRARWGASFWMHLAEGTDARAAGEYARLKALGCAGARTVIIHGVGLTDADIADAARQVRALVTCPTTNLYLLGDTARLGAWRAAGGRVWVGSDSRLTAQGDLLDEIAVLCDEGEPAPQALRRTAQESMMPGGAPDDWIVVPENARMPLRRADLGLVVRGGRALIGDPPLMRAHARAPHEPCWLDGREKRIDARLAMRIRIAGGESGLTLK
jgi:hypothetical protein